jgi:hypothetical protein
MPGECKSLGPLGRVCNRWKRNTAQAGQDYENGIRNPKRSWGKATCNAQDCYKAGVDKAHSRNSFQKGAKRAGNKGWMIPTIKKGPTRFAQGVSRGGDDYRSGFSPYHKVIRRTTLPARFPKRDPRNIARANYLCTALGRAKAGKTTTKKVTCPDR